MKFVKNRAQPIGHLDIDENRRVSAGNGKSRTQLLLGVLLAVSTFPVLADSTTGTTFTVEGNPVPGGHVTVHVTVTGKHLVFVPPNSVFGGNVEVSLQGAVVGSVQASQANSTGISAGQCIPDITGACVTYKFPAQRTDVSFNVTLPVGVSSFVIGARYAGDKDSHSSDAVPVTLTPKSAPADLYSIDPTNTGSGKTEVHILDASTAYSTYKLHAATALQLVNPDQWSFALGDANGDGVTDIYAISRNGNGTPNVEVHILDGATNYSTFLAHYSIGMGAVQNGLAWTFDLGDYNRDGKPDLYVFQKVGGASGKTEVHIYSGADGFVTKLADAALPMPSTGADDAWEFHVIDVDGDGKPDIVGVAKQNGLNTEVHIVSGSSGYTAYSQETATGLSRTGSDSRWVFGLNDYDKDGKIDLFAINKMGTNGVEVHTLKGAAYQDFNLHVATPIGMLPTDASKTLLINK